MSATWVIVISIVSVLLFGLVGFYLYTSNRFLNRLRTHSTFSGSAPGSCPEPLFEYAGADDPNLAQLKEAYRLDQVAGDGTELERIVNLMEWVHKLSKHAANPKYPEELNARHLIHLCQTENFSLNCWMKSLILNEVYLAMGFKSRQVHMRPPAIQPKESHVVVSVYSPELGKWVMMDPDMCGYLMDADGTVLNVHEIRQRLVEGQPMQQSAHLGGFTKIFGKRTYPWYLSKNIFRYACPRYSLFNYYSNHSGREVVELIPDGYREALLASPEVTERGNTFFYINDEGLFWELG